MQTFVRVLTSYLRLAGSRPTQAADIGDAVTAHMTANNHLLARD